MAAKKGHPVSEITKRKIGLANKGHTVSIETREKLRKARYKQGNPFKGKKHSKETKRKMSEKAMGRKFSKKTINKIRKAKIGHKHSAETRKKISRSHKGKKSYLWKGGISKINDRIRKSVEYKLWREAVFKRDRWTCIWCGKKGSTIQADHIKPFVLYPELRFAIDNGRTLCEACHRKTNTFGRKALNYK